MESYFSKSDLELVVLARKNDEKAFDAIVSRYNEFIYFKARLSFIEGYDVEDIYQEALIGLFRAVYFSFDLERGISFNTYAMNTIANSIKSLYIRVMRKKRGEGNNGSALSFDMLSDSRFEELPVVSETPETYCVKEDLINDLYSNLTEILSEKERRIMFGRIDGISYEEIADKEGTKVKNVYNAVDRARKKVNKKLDADYYYKGILD